MKYPHCRKTRHTSINNALLYGLSPHKVEKYVGHVDARMICKHYAAAFVTKMDDLRFDQALTQSLHNQMNPNVPLWFCFEGQYFLTSKMVHEMLKAADVLAQENIDIEVIDLLSISPWDKETVFNSVGKTHRLLIAHEAVKSFGVGAEVSAAVAEEILDELDAPIMRVGAPFVPIPFSLEKAYLPNAEDVISAVKKTMERTF